jgi:hypothetical protein
MDEEKPTRRPGPPKAAHLPARGPDIREETSRLGGPDLMAAGGETESPAAWVLRVCGRPTWGRAPRVDRLELLTSTTLSTEAPMNQEQIDVINIVQEVLRATVISLGAMNPQAIGLVARGMRGAAQEGKLSPMAAQMLADLATGLEMIERAGNPRH